MATNCPATKPANLEAMARDGSRLYVRHSSLGSFWLGGPLVPLIFGVRY